MMMGIAFLVLTTDGDGDFGNGADEYDRLSTCMQEVWEDPLVSFKALGAWLHA